MATNRKFVARNGLLAPDAEFTGSASVTLPAGTTAERPQNPVAGMTRFNVDLGEYEGYDGDQWAPLGGGGAVGGGTDEVFYENDQQVTANYTITAGRNAMTTGPIEIDDGVEITVPDGSRWVIL